MATMGTAFNPELPTAGKFGVYYGVEDNTAGTAPTYWTSDQSGYAHIDYGRVDVIAGTTIGGTTYSTANRNDFGYVSQSTRILNFFPNNELVRISIRRGRTRPDQWDDVGECTIEVLNNSGASDPDNNASRYKRLNTQKVYVTNAAGNGTAITYTAVNNFSNGDSVFVSGVAPAALNVEGTVSNVSSTAFTLAGTSTATFTTAGNAFKRLYGSWVKPGLYGQVVWGSSGGTAIPLFTGVLEAVEPTDDRYSTAVYTFVDRLALAGRATLGVAGKLGAAGDKGFQRLKAVLDASRLINVLNGNGGTNTVEQVIDIQGFAEPVALVDSGDTALDMMKLIVSGQAGRIFCDRSGVMRVWDRTKMASNVVGTAATFTDTPGTVAGYGYDEIHTNQGQNFVYNSAIVKIGEKVTATARVDDSIAQYGERRAEIDCILQTSADALTLAVFYATNWSNPTKSVASLSLQAYAYSQADFDVLAALDLQQRVRVYRRLPGGRTLDVSSVIEGIEIDIDPSTRRFTFYLSPVDTTTLVF